MATQELAQVQDPARAPGGPPSPEAPASASADAPTPLEPPAWIVSTGRRVSRRQARNWDRRSVSGLEKVTAAVLAAARPDPGYQVIDLGCGDGQVSLPLAEHGARVLAIDASPAMISRLREAAAGRSVPGLRMFAWPLEHMCLPAHSADLVVSCYALHRLRDTEKARIVAAAYGWLRPGGTLVVADMMFGRGATSQDRAIIRFKVRALARKGIGGWWRIAKNACRYLIRVQEHPVSVTAWTAMLARAGFTSIHASSVVNEAGLVSGRRPAA
jgi:ubiquinone/menaquinone biosynthesis C-methylase UbiE